MRISGSISAGVLLLFSALAGQAQTAPKSLTITASRSNAQQPDQAVYALALSSPLNTSLDDAVAALASAGITASDLSSVQSAQIVNPGGTPNCVSGLQWIFTVGVPFSKTKDTNTLLTTLRQSIAGNKTGLMLDFAIQGVRVSPQAQGSAACPLADLVADARAQAQKLASAAGASVGPIEALADRSPAAVPVAVYAALSFANGNIPINVIPGNACSGGFSSTGAVFGAAPSCSLAVQFTLLQ